MQGLPQISDEIFHALHEAGLAQNRPLVVHSGMGPIINELRRRGMRGSALAEQTMASFADAVTQAAGPAGTICVPGFFYNYARKGATYNLRTSPPDKALGAFPNYFFRHRMQNRSLGPFTCLMTSGSQADLIATSHSCYGNGNGSAWAQLTDTDGWVIFFGCTAKSMTFTHHVEQLIGVPHLYNKIYRVPVVDMNGQEHPFAICSVRYLDARFPVTYNLEPFVADIQREGILIGGQWSGVPFSFARLRTVQDYLSERLTADPFYLLEQEPSFVRGTIPDDGPNAAEG